jgi:START domain.
MTKRNVIITVVLMLLIIVSTSFAADKYQWKLVDTEDGCQIYTSEVPGKDFIAAKATCLMPARIEVVGTILRDIENFPEWMQDCKATKMLKVIDDDKDVYIFWFRHGVMLPYSDRDLVLKSKSTYDVANGHIVINADLTNEIPYDAGKGYVRMPTFYSVYTLDWVDREHTKVTFMVDPDVGKSIPASVANMLIKTTPYKSLKRMMKMAKLSKYIEAAKTNKYGKIAEETAKAKAVSK